MNTSVRNRVLMLVATSLYPHDGRVRREATSLVAAGYQVSVICPRYPQRAKQPWRETIDGVDVFRYPAPLRRFSVFGYIWGYIYTVVAMFLLSLYVLFRPGFDVIHIHNPPDILTFIAAFYKLLGKRFVFDHHDLAPEMFEAIFGQRFRLAHGVLVWLEQLSCRLADRVISTNQSYKQLEIQRSGIPAESITIVRNGPELNLLRPVAPDPDLRQKADVIIGYVGAMGLHDGVDYLLRAIRHLIYDLNRTDFFCVLIGRGKSWDKMKSLSEQLGLSDFVWFTGFVEHADLLRYLSTADICVAPEPSNSFNDRSTFIKMTEYIAMGKPIVAFDLPEHRVTAQNAALYASPNDELDFARKIAWLMDHPQQRQEMGQIGRQRAETELSWSHQIKHLLSVYESFRTQMTGNYEKSQNEIRPS